MDRIPVVHASMRGCTSSSCKRSPLWSVLVPVLVVLVLLVLVLVLWLVLCPVQVQVQRCKGAE